MVEHLYRAASIVAGWGADSSLQNVALLHAAYGTDGFDGALLPIEDRHVLQVVAGQTVEESVYLYGSCDRATTYPRLARGEMVFTDRFTGSPRTVDDVLASQFVELTAANELDVMTHSAELRARHASDVTAWLVAGADLLSMPALASVRQFRAEHRLG